MAGFSSSDSTRDERVNQVIAEYLKSVEEGTPSTRQEVLARHPDLADELAAFFADRDRFEQAAGPLRAGADIPTEDSFAPRPTGPGTKIRYFGDYELLEEIARGGMGVVYKARQVNLKRIVALKLILAGQLAGPQEVARFHAEAEAAAKLDHPGIVPIFEVGQYGGQHYFSMAFVDGESLARRVAQGVMEPREAAALMKKVAEAIAYAHVEGVIHRDLKPGNILLKQSPESRVQSPEQDGARRPSTASGSRLSTLDVQPMVTDFGLAKRVEGESQGLTATGQVLGTPSRSLITIAWEHFVVFDLATGKEIRRFDRPGLVTSSPSVLAVSVDDRLVASGNGLSVEVFDAMAGRQIHSFKGHSNDIRAVAFSPDGRYVASGGGDSTVRLWDLETGQEAIALRAGRPVSGVAFSSSGHFLAAADMYHTVTVWDATPVAASSVLALPTGK